ncbi:MAG: DEAD/DEAH box helicase [Candidatus Omnitrophica bacterium]|nr:DEAD/DEAH box helicase [Candidatus Omnitrophota bacterium]
MNNVTQENNQNVPSFYGMGIAPRILDILDSFKFTVPTPIQSQTIPLAIEGKDVVGIAQTGTGKTLSFAIPMIQSLAAKKGTGLVLAPTRELAIQIEEAFRPIVSVFKLEAVCLIGGAPMEPQLKALRRNPRVIIATPGRLIDHMSNWNVLPQEVEMLVLDEADRMLDMGFLPQIEMILGHLPKERQTMLFSATMPKEIVGIAAKYMQLPVSVEIAPSGTMADNVTHELYIVKKSAKTQLLRQVLSQYHGPVLLFSRTKHNATRLARDIRKMGHRASEIHSNRTLDQRRAALEGFKSGKYKVLVATDIASRGIDVTGIELVINYDIPDDASNYVHRIGRTARAGQKGHAISFAMPDQKRDVEDIEKLINATLPVSRHPKVMTEEFTSETKASPQYKKKTKRPFRPRRR